MRPILVPNVNCLPDPASFVNTQIAGIEISNSYEMGRAFLDMIFLTEDDNADPYTAVKSGNPVVHVNNMSALDAHTEFYSSGGELPLTRVLPVIAIDLSTGQYYILTQTGEFATWSDFMTPKNQAALERGLTSLGILFDHSTPHPIFK